MKRSANPATFVQEMGRFGVTGLANTAITLVLIGVLHKGFGVDYLMANGIGFALGFINSFFMNRSWTFNSNGNLLRESVLFGLVFLVSYLVQLGALIVFSNAMGMSLLLSQILALAAYTLTSFTGNKWVTFRKKTLDSTP